MLCIFEKKADIQDIHQKQSENIKTESVNLYYRPFHLQLQI